MKCNTVSLLPEVKTTTQCCCELRQLKFMTVPEVHDSICSTVVESPMYSYGGSCVLLSVIFPGCWSKMLECGMLEQDRRALRRRSAVLCKQLVVDELLIQSLQADDILTESMAEGIMVC